MIDLSQYRQASFRGIPFHVATSSRRLSHRIDKKAYPLGNRGLVTDMGLDDPVFELAIFVLGDDVLQRRRALEDAFAVIGPGKLVHPTRGTIDVVVETARDDENMTELGVADFTVTFVQSGDAIGPVARIDTQANLLVAADNAEASVIESYDLDLKTVDDDQAVDYEKVLSAATDLYRMSQTVTLASIQGRAIDMALEYAAEASGLGSAGLLRQTFTLAQTIGNSFGGSAQGLGALSGTLAANGSAWNISQKTTNTRIAPVISDLSGRFMAVNASSTDSEVVNRNLMGQAVFDALSVTASRGVATTEFESFQQAIDVRDTLVSALTIAANATTTNDPKRASARNQSLRNLRTAVARDISERSTALPMLDRHVPQATAPARVISYQLTGTVDDSLPARNAIHHPSFVKAGETVLYLKERSNG